MVFGGLVSAGADSVRLTATVLDVATGTPAGEIELREASARMDRLADSLTVWVLRELGRTRAIGVVRSASLGSKSLPALKAFLQGEQFLRRSEWDSALAYQQRAIALDSGFALAWSHAGMAAGWQHAANDSLSRTYKLRAGALNHGLAPRESLVVQSESLAAVVYAGPVQLGVRLFGYGRRMIGTLDEAVRRYPNDPELWYMLGDARYHAGSMAGLSPRASLVAFDRAIALDSAFTPSYVHAIPLSLEFGGAEAGRRYATKFLEAGGMGVYAKSTSEVLALLDPRTRSAAISFLADSADEHLFQTVWLSINRWLDVDETTIAVIRARATAEQAKGIQSQFSTIAFPMALASRGHIKEAAARTAFPALVSQLALLGAISPDSAAQVARSWIGKPGEGHLFLGAMLAAAHDTIGIQSAIRFIEGRQRPLPRNMPAIALDILAYLNATNQAYLALARSDSAAALRLFDARPDSACFGGCWIDDLIHVQLLAARGRLADAATRLERPLGGFVGGIVPFQVLRALERGRVYERLGDREKAIEGYNLVLEAWRNPDPELKTYVDEARAGLARLSAEKKAS